MTVAVDEPVRPDYVQALRSDELREETSLREALDHAASEVHDQPELARHLATLCVSAADRYGLPAVSAQGHYVLARILAERGELAPALAAIERAQDEWNRAGQHLLALRTNLGRMQVLDDLGRHEEAIEVGRTLLASLDVHTTADERVLRDELRATAWNNVGVAHSFLGDHHATIEAYASAEAGYAELGLTTEVAKTRANRGIELLEVGRGREALTALTDARQRFADMGDRMWDAKCRGNVAQAHVQLGELVAALRELAAARVTLDDLKADAESARLQATGARLYLTAGLHREAHGEAAEAAQFLLTAGMLHDAASASLTCALSLLAVGDLDAVQPWLTQAKELFLQVGDRQSQAHVTLAEADAAALGDRIEEPVLLAGRAVDEFRRGGWLVQLAWATLRQADYSPDAVAAEVPLTAAGKLIDALQLPALRYAYLLRRGRRARETGDDDSAERLLREAVRIAERLGATLSSAELATAFRHDHTAAHDALVDLLVARDEPGAVSAASRIADLAKARTLRDFVTGALGERWQAASDETDAMIAQRRADLSSTYHAMQEQSDRRLYASLQRRAAELERDLTLRRLDASARHADDRGAQDDRHRVRAASARTSVPVLSYHFAGDDLIVFVTAGDTRSATRVVSARAVLDAQLDSLNAQWSRFTLGRAFVQRHGDALLVTATDCMRALYDVLVRPVRNVLDEYDADELVVVPHRRLHQVPFSGLHDGSDVLARRWSITLAPTAADAGAAARPVPPGELVVFAVPDAATPAIADEARVLSDAWPNVRAHFAAAATSATFRAAVPGPAVLHVACHGMYRHANPMFSALRLADRWITASELLELDFGGALVTLSACETGRHASNSAEPVGLAWAFLAAGASGVVVSQWLVDDEVTAQLMASLYRGRRASSRSPATSWSSSTPGTRSRRSPALTPSRSTAPCWPRAASTSCSRPIRRSPTTRRRPTAWHTRSPAPQASSRTPRPTSRSSCATRSSTAGRGDNRPGPPRTQRPTPTNRWSPRWNSTPHTPRRRARTPRSPYSTPESIRTSPRSPAGSASAGTTSTTTRTPTTSRPGWTRTTTGSQTPRSDTARSSAASRRSSPRRRGYCRTACSTATATDRCTRSPRRSWTRPPRARTRINLSFGTADAIKSHVLSDAITEAQHAGVLVVGAAGNDGNNRPHFPAAQAGVLSTSALATTGTALASFSNWGPWADVAAPGQDVVGPLPGGVYAHWAGTSMAAPVVSGQAALLFSQRPGSHLDKITQAITNSARVLPRHVVHFGSVNVGASLDWKASHH